MSFWVSHRCFDGIDVYYRPDVVGIYLPLPFGQAIARNIDRGTWDRHVRAEGPRQAAVELLVLYGAAYSIHSNPKDAQETHDAWDRWCAKNSTDRRAEEELE